MNEFNALLSQGNAWLFIPSAILLGSLHGLEPGHSKTMMAAFIIAIKGTIRQAVMLGLAATVSHTAIVWLIAFGGMYVSRKFTSESAEPWLQMISAVIILGTAFWMFRRARKDEENRFGDGQENAHPHPHPHNHPHPHHHLHPQQDHSPRIFLGPMHPAPAGVKAGPDEYQTAHELAHAGAIARRFSGDRVGNMQIVLFGLTGGLIPCPAAITVLLICLQLKEVALGAAMVLCFSIGLALTLVTVGVVAAVGARQAAKRWRGFSVLAGKAPYLSCLLMAIVGLYMGIPVILHVTGALARLVHPGHLLG
ncbi:nickel/cobalt efflux transporter [Sodalis sp. RH16]|uniref:nickel/cobalt efflux transporter n=1 Tax=Sodalis sp. RH16 TaxID=3394331 RepID=UPI0039B5E68C